MASLNEKLIQSVYDGLILHRPQLKSLVDLDEDDDDDGEVDIRLLADLIIRSYPWPIGVELRRLFSAQLAEPDRMRLEQLFKTLERTLQFLAFVQASQILTVATERKLAIGSGLGAEFTRRWSTITLGNLTWLIKRTQDLLDENGLVPFMEEAKQELTADFFSNCNFWIPERNAIGHYEIHLTDEQIQIKCVELQERLMAILRSLAFLAKYKLVSVRSIQVEKSRRGEAHFNHQLNILNSSNSDFKAQDVDTNLFTESRSVLLLRTTKRMNEYLNMSPFVIDTGIERIDTKEKTAIKKDIFLYARYANDTLHYSGTEATDKYDLRALSVYPQMMEDLKAFLHIFS
ncbi:MAG: hypothetical protein JNL43_02555 [Flavobacteriales bacterium]|nr:hypothetical protein [Flavobacteriales bacterium]